MDMDSQVRAAFPGCIVTQVSEKQWQVNAQDHLLDVRHTRGAWQCKDHRDKSLFVVRSKVVHELLKLEEERFEKRYAALTFWKEPPEFPGWVLAPIREGEWSLEQAGLRFTLTFLPADQEDHREMWRVYSSFGGFGPVCEDPHVALSEGLKDAQGDIEERIRKIKQDQERLPALEQQLALVRSLNDP